MAVSPKNINYADILLPLEFLCRDKNSLSVTNFDKDFIKSRLRDCSILSFRDTKSFLKTNLSREGYIALKSLMKNKKLIIQKAAKGNTVALINRADYIFKIKPILKDTCKFENIEIYESKVLNNLINMENRIIGLFEILKEKNEISRENLSSMKQPHQLFFEREKLNRYTGQKKRLIFC